MSLLKQYYFGFGDSFTIHQVTELATVPKYPKLPRFFDTVFCHYRVLLGKTKWVTVSKKTFFEVGDHLGKIQAREGYRYT